MTIAMNAKVHRYDATLALIKVFLEYLKKSLKIGDNNCPFKYFMNKRHFTCDHKTTLLRKMDVILHDRFPTRTFLDQYIDKTQGSNLRHGSHPSVLNSSHADFQSDTSNSRSHWMSGPRCISDWLK